MKKPFFIIGIPFLLAVIAVVILLPFLKQEYSHETSSLSSGVDLDKIASMADTQLAEDMAAYNPSVSYDVVHRSIINDPRKGNIITVSYDIDYVETDGTTRQDKLQYQIQCDLSSGLYTFMP